MTLAGWIGALLSLLSTLGLGVLAIELCRFRGALIRSWACCYLVGQLVVLLLVLSTAFLPWGIPAIQSLSITVVVAGWGIGVFLKRRLWGGRLLTACALSLGVSVLAFPDVILVVQRVPLWEWDARSSWFFHGKALFLGGKVDAAYFTNALYSWSILDYPLFVPAQAAWTAQSVGEWNDYSVKAFLLFNFAAYVYLLWRVLRHRGTRLWLALLAVAIVFDQETYSYVSGCADNHYIIALLIFFVAVGSGAWPGEAGFLALMLSFAANIKNEGKVYVALILGVAGAAWVFRRWRDARAATCGVPSVSPVTRDLGGVQGETGKAVLLSACLGLGPLLLWHVFRIQHGIVNPVRIVQRLIGGGDGAGLLADRLPLITGYLAEYCRFQRLEYVAGVLLLLTLLRVSLRSRRRDPGLAPGWSEGLAWVALLGSGLAIVAAYVVTPLDCEFHLRTSAGRLLLFPRLLLYLTVFYVAESIWPSVSTAGTGPAPDVAH